MYITESWFPEYQLKIIVNDYLENILLGHNL